MRLTSRGSVFYLSAPESTSTLKTTGWRWLNARKVWLTSRYDKAYAYIEHADSETVDKLRVWKEDRDAAVADSIAASSDIDIPAPPGRTYRPYQLAGAAFMLDRKFSLNADVPRLGKTIQTLAVINWYRRPLRVLVLCPAVAKSNWCAEARSWLLHPTTIGYCEGNDNPQTDFLVCNYDILARHHGWMLAQSWDVVVFDEAHYLKNPKSARTQLALQLTGNLHTIFLTGTPAFTRPIDLWSIIEMCDRDKRVSKNWFSFVRRYCDAKKKPNGWDFNGHSNEEELQYKLRSTFMIRRNKSDVMTEIPPNRNTIYLPKKDLDRMIKRELSIAQKEMKGLLDALELGDAARVELFSEFDGRVEEFGPISTVRRELALCKVPMVVECCKELLETEDKIVVFSHHRDVTMQLAELLDFARIPGGLSTAQRDRQLDAFRTSKRGIVGNIQSMGTAISLKEADVAVFAELSWVPSEIDQCEERIWDPTKTAPVSIYRLVFEDSLEARIANVLESRQASMSRLLNYKMLTSAA